MPTSIHGPGLPGQFEAGPYVVHVTGTQLSVAWDDDSERLEVGVTHGSVRVDGPTLPDSGAAVRTGERLIMEKGTRLFAPLVSDNPDRSAVPKETVGADDGPNAAAAPHEDDTEIDTPSSQLEKTKRGLRHLEPSRKTERKTYRGTSLRNLARKKSFSWRWYDLATQSDYNNAYTAAKQEQVYGRLADLSSAELRLLVDVSRFARDGERSSLVLHTLRRRFPRTQSANTAAFLLGRVTLELSNNPGEALVWFERYLKDDPDGPLAEEALGRLIDASQQAGDHSRAVRSAKEYLVKYPKGIFREVARAALAR
ncbi:MAG: hypothetical protein R3C68_02170 [Myxococcota bacterium]